MTAPDQSAQDAVRAAKGPPVAGRLRAHLSFLMVAIAYLLALAGLSLTANRLWPALLFALGIALLSGAALATTRSQTPRPVRVVRPQVELSLVLVWYVVVLALAALTGARQIELVNQFTNWGFLVIVPFTLLFLARRRGSGLRATLRSIGLTRTGLKDGLRLAAVIVPLTVPLLYLVGDQQRAAVDMALLNPAQALVSFLVAFPLALLTAGFVEEFFFRGLLQSRLAHYTGSEWHGLLIASLLFGLFHLPMYLFSPFEPTHGSLVSALASVITEQAVMGILLGVLWTRTHNLAAPVLVHAFTNALAWMTTVSIGGG